MDLRSNILAVVLRSNVGIERGAVGFGFCTHSDTYSELVVDTYFNTYSHSYAYAHTYSNFNTHSHGDTHSNSNS
jgi:hypothetical protein